MVGEQAETSQIVVDRLVELGLDDLGVLGGLVVSTAFTLVVIPTVYFMASGEGRR